MSKQICFASLVTIIQLLALITAGSAAASSVTASPTSMNFGSVNVGSGAQQQVRITNSMPFGVIITSVTVSSNYFGLNGVTAPLGVAAGASATLTVSFAPKAAGAQTGKIVVLGRGFTTALEVALLANGVSSGGTTSISVVPPSANFGNVPVAARIRRLLPLRIEAAAPSQFRRSPFPGPASAGPALATARKLAQEEAPRLM
jgi:hypothetical protein